jgi:gliding motility-associated-like protein
VIARAENQNGCPGFATVTLSIANNPLPAVSRETCDEGTSGIASFNLSDITASLTQGLPPGMQAAYFTSLADAASGTNPITTTTFQNTTPSAQTIYAVITNGPDCYGAVPVQLIVHTLAPGGFGPEAVSICAGQPRAIGVAPGFSSYLWNTGQTANQIPVSQAGTYTVTVTDANGCQASKIFNVSASERAVFGGVLIDDLDNADNSITVNYSGTGDYEFSLDGNAFQDDPVFSDVAPGQYSVFIHDKNGCGTTVSPAFYVLGYPRFFTPNGDGVNDTWQIRNLSLRQPNAAVTIFDRFGKLLCRFSAGSPGWDGKFGGRDMPSDDYWFTIGLDRTVKGHFSLKR